MEYTLLLLSYSSPVVDEILHAGKDGPADLNSMHNDGQAFLQVYQGYAVALASLATLRRLIATVEATMSM